MYHKVTDMKILKDRLSRSVVTLGKFDCLHLGHKKLINEAGRVALKTDAPLVAYTFSNVLRESVFSFEERLGMFEELGCDYVYIDEFNDELKNLSPEAFFEKKLINNLGAVHIVAGEDWRFGRDRAGDVRVLRQLCDEHRIGLSVVKKFALYDEEVSSTAIRELFRQGNIIRANEYLGRSYYIRGKVSDGKKLGRELGFPTANIILTDELVYPRDGVYATTTLVSGREYPSVTNIGTNPTVKDNSRRAETHILDFDGDLYGQEIKVYFCDFIREEKRFDSIEQLKSQIDEDCIYRKKQKI